MNKLKIYLPIQFLKLAKDRPLFNFVTINAVSEPFCYFLISNLYYLLKSFIVLLDNFFVSLSLSLVEKKTDLQFSRKADLQPLPLPLPFLPACFWYFTGFLFNPENNTYVFGVSQVLYLILKIIRYFQDRKKRSWKQQLKDRTGPVGSSWN